MSVHGTGSDRPELIQSIGSFNKAESSAFEDFLDSREANSGDEGWDLREVEAAFFSYFKTTLASRNLDPLIEAGETLENSDVTGALGLTWSPLADFKIMASYRRGFRAPNIFALGTLGARPGNRYNIPSLGLRGTF